MVKKERDTGRDPSAKELRETERISQLPPEQQRAHPGVVVADPTKLTHINTYGALPEYYLDQAFSCRRCGKWEIWRAHDQKWYYEDAKGRTDAKAVECHDCRLAKKQSAITRNNQD